MEIREKRSMKEKRIIYERTASLPAMRQVLFR